ncbi:MAG: integration host factor subunit beta [Planctomycetota bacterium]|jgi:nucleoid DNA-binding protein|nr:integration host factor subunit beta [Planctomycetota bacterium]
MPKLDMVQEIAKKTGLRQLEVKQIVQLTLDGIIETLIADRRLELRNFGVFTVKSRQAKMARNPKTGEPVMAPARQAVTFKPGKIMLDRVNGKIGAPQSASPADSGKS